VPNIVFGLLALAMGLWGLSVWWWSVTEVLRGLVPLILLAVGFIALSAGVMNIEKDSPEDAENEKNKSSHDDELNIFETDEENKNQTVLKQNGAGSPVEQKQEKKVAKTKVVATAKSASTSENKK